MNIVKTLISIVTVVLGTFLFFLNNAISQPITIIPHKYLPKHFFVVDKNKQRLYLIEYNGTINIITTVPCSTGANNGDKFSQGDEKTPEGIYFLTKKIHRPLDFVLYGNLAYATDYPNPIDKLFDKDGGGIWLHGRGKKLVPYDTKGCIAIKTSTLKKLGAFIKPHLTPILIGSKVIQQNQNKYIVREINDIQEKINKWIKDWENKDREFFTFYDPLSFSKTARIPFKKFMDQKLFYFKKYKWIDIFISDLKILQGPYYVVTYFFELYRSPKFLSQGLKKIYWMKINGNYKIVASKWINLPINLEASYLSYHSDKIINFLKEWKHVWEQKNYELYAQFYDKNAKQNKLKGIKSILNHKKRIWDNSSKIKINIRNINISLHKKGFVIRFLQEYQSQKHNDIGVKTIIVYPLKDTYKILLETWSPL